MDEQLTSDKLEAWKKHLGWVIAELEKKIQEAKAPGVGQSTVTDGDATKYRRYYSRC